MDESLLKSLEQKITNVGSDDVYKKKIGNLTIWFSPLTYTDQAFVQEALEDTKENSNSINDAKLKSLSRSIVGIDDVDLRPYRNGAKVFQVSEIVPGKGKSNVKVELAKYMEYKIRAWGQPFVDLAFDVFADITESSQKKFSEGVVFENTKDPRVELAELEVRVHELRARLGLPVLEERVGSQYKNLQGEPEVEDTPGPVPDINVNFDQEAQEESEEATAQEAEAPDEESSEPLVEKFDSEEAILQSVVPPVETQPEPPVPVRTVPVAQPTNINVPASPIQNALSARRNIARPARAVSAVPAGAKSSPDRPFDATPSVNKDEVIDTPFKPPTSRVRVDPPVGQQSVNPRFKRT